MKFWLKRKQKKQKNLKNKNNQKNSRRGKVETLESPKKVIAPPAKQQGQNKNLLLSLSILIGMIKLKTVFVNNRKVSKGIPINEVYVEKNVPIPFYLRNLVMGKGRTRSIIPVSLNTVLLEGKRIHKAEATFCFSGLKLISEEEMDNSTVEHSEDAILVYWKTKKNYWGIDSEESGGIYLNGFSPFHARDIEGKEASAEALAILAPGQYLEAYVSENCREETTPLILKNDRGKIIVKKTSKIKKQ